MIIKRITSKVHKWQRSRLLRSYDSYWESLRGKHNGRPGWVIGNGPSLRTEDLDRLQGEVCIASNRICLAYPQTKWRPSYVTCIDDLVVDKHKNELLDKYEKIHVPSYMIRKFGKNEKVVYWRCIGNASRGDHLGISFSDNGKRGFYGGHTVTYENLQFAAFLGCSPIYIIGCDHYYEAESNVKADTPVRSLALNHFHPEYRKEGELVNPAPIREMNLAYEQAFKWSQISNIPIYNATRGGCLEIFPRVDFGSVFPEQ